MSEPAAPRDPVEGLGYEQARDELTEVVRKLEAGGLSLDDAVALWEFAPVGTTVVVTA